MSDNIFLGVNIDHVATLRQARGTRYPSPVEAGLMAETAGADGITLHLREDRRHIQDDDVYILRKTLKTKMNFEMALTDEMLKIALDIKPHDICLVPEKRQELTTEGGLDVVSHKERITQFVQELNNTGSRVSLFVDADERQIDACAETGAQVIEIHTGAYADAKSYTEQQSELRKIIEMAQYAKKLDLIVHAGHGLTIHNVEPIAKILEIKELNIGHALVSQALFIGWTNAIQEMKQIMLNARKASSK